VPHAVWTATLPDSYPGSVTYSGVISPAQPASPVPQPQGLLTQYAPGPGGPTFQLAAGPISFSGSLALPAVPSAGQSLNWILEINLSTGAVALKPGAAASTGSQVTPAADAGFLALFSHTITAGDAVPWQRAPLRLN
jgi:hypothetical protein